MSKRIEEADYVFLPLEEASVCPSGYVRCLRDKYWRYHPNKGLAFYSPKRRQGFESRLRSGIPQCNTNKSVAELIAKNCPFDGWEIMFVPAVYVRIDLSDYC
jgi:hypothetical protein